MAELVAFTPCFCPMFSIWFYAIFTIFYIQKMSSSKRIPALLFGLLIITILSSFIRSTDAARFCYSGQNSRFAQKHCSSGSMDLDYVCQKYTCEGGRCSFILFFIFLNYPSYRTLPIPLLFVAPFVLRTCALKTTGCLAGPRICKFSGKLEFIADNAHF